MTAPSSQPSLDAEDDSIWTPENCSHRRLAPRGLFWSGAKPEDWVTDALYLFKSGLALLALLVSGTSVCVFGLRYHRQKKLRRSSGSTHGAVGSGGATACGCSYLTQMLLHLSVCESVFSFTALLFESYYLMTAPPAGHRFPAGPPWLSSLILYPVWIVYKASSVTRNWLIVHLAWRRWRAVANPTAPVPPSKRSVNLVTCFLALASVLITVPRSLEVYHTMCPATWQILDIETSEFTMSRAYSWIYPRCFFALHSLLPVCLLLLVSFLTLCRLRQTHRRMLRDAPLPFFERLRRQRQAQAGSVNRTVLVLCAVFVICELPMLVAGALKDIDWPRVQVFQGVANVLTTADSVANFVIYFLSIPQFKLQLKDCLKI